MKIGVTFSAELQSAGVSLDGLVWDEEAGIITGSLSNDQLGAAELVLAKHDPTKTLAPPVSGDAIISLLTNAQAAQVAKDALRISWRDDVPVTNPKLVRIAKAIGKSPEDLWALAAS